MAELRIRPLAAEDSIEELTEFLHRAYQELADRGLRYLATHQDAATTRARIEGGECLLAELDGVIVGTITWHDAAHSEYPRPNAAGFSQFGVDPDRRGTGVGRALLLEVERRARASGATELACDTAEPATHLTELYVGWGYEIVGRVQWDVTNYPSVILSKKL